MATTMFATAFALSVIIAIYVGWLEIKKNFDFIPYNAEGNITGNDVINALSKVYKQNYDSVVNELHDICIQNDNKIDNYNSIDIVKKSLERHGYTKIDYNQYRKTPKLLNYIFARSFVRSHSFGKYVLIGWTPETLQNGNIVHFMAVDNGLMYDTKDFSMLRISEIWQCPDNWKQEVTAA